MNHEVSVGALLDPERWGARASVNAA